MEILSQLADPARLSPTMRGEIEALERETDAELAEEGLLNLSQRAERSGELETAAQLYRVLGGQTQSAMAGRARQRFQAMSGGSPGALRWEFFANRFTEQLFDPASLVGMGVGGLVFRGARLWTLSRLAQSTMPSLPIAASIFATGIGLSFETTAFVISAGVTEMALGQERSWSFDEYSRDWASTAILLGSMRSLGSAVPLLLRSRLGTSPLSLPWRSQLGIGMAQQAAMFGGILGSRFLTSSLGLRESDENLEATLSESLATLIHFNAAGRLAHAVFGPRWAAFERDLDWRSAELGVFRSPYSRVQNIHGEWVRPDYLPRADRLRSIPSWSRHLRSILLSPMWFAMGVGGMGGGFGGPRRPICTFELLQDACSENGPRSTEAIRRLILLFPEMSASEQSQILHIFVRRANTYDGGLRERLAYGLVWMLPEMKAGIRDSLRSTVSGLISRSERGRQFRLLLDLGFGSNSVPSLEMQRQVQVAPRVLEYLDDRGTHPQAQAVAKHFLKHILSMPEEVQRDVAVEIVRRGLGEVSLLHFYTSIRQSRNQLAVVRAWDEEMASSQIDRQHRAAQSQLILARVFDGEARSAAIRSIVGRLGDPDLGIRERTMNSLQRMENEFDTPYARREYLDGFNSYLARAVEALQSGTASLDQVAELMALPVSVRYRLVRRLIALPEPSASTREFVEACTQDSRFADFTLNLRYDSLRGEEP